MRSVNALGIAAILALTYGTRAGQNRTASGDERTSSRALLQQLATGTAVRAEPEKCGLRAISHALSSRQSLNADARVALKTLLTRPSLQTSALRGNFRIHFDTSGTNAPAMLDASHNRIEGTWAEYVDSVAAIARYVATYEVDTLGYQAPPSDGALGGGPEYDIYIMDLGFEYGETSPDDDLIAEGGRSSTFVTIDNDFIFVSPPANRGMPALRVTLAHEYHHAIQIGSYGYWPSEVYFHEITSVWLEDVVYTEVNDYYNYLFAGWGQFAHPEVTFIANDNIMYSRGIWGQYIAKRFGRDAMRHTWEDIRSMRPLLAIDDALRTFYSSSFRLAFGEWTLWNYYTGRRSNAAAYYPEGANFPEIVETAVDFTPPSRTVPGAIEPLSGGYYQVIESQDTLTLALANIDYASALAATLPPQSFTYLLNIEPLDASYYSTGAGIYFKLQAANASNWWTWTVVNGVVGVPGNPEGVPFPNPFRSDGTSSVYIPSSAVNGTLSIFTSNMDLVYSRFQASTVYFGKRVFSWNGMTSDNTPANSGVYIFALRLDDRTLTGKIVLVRK